MFKKSADGLLAADLFIYVDNGLPIGHTKKFCLGASRRWGLMCSCLGIQDVSRKVQPPSHAQGTWAGTIINTEGGVLGLVYQERWDKTQRLIAEPVGVERERMYGILRARIESISGFLVYVFSTYRDMTPYFKGVCLTMDSLRSYRDE